MSGGGILFNIVLLDDEPWVEIDLAQSIPWTQLGFELPQSFSRSTEAYEFIIENNPDVVITDIVMPVMDGLQLIEKCRQNNCTSKFVILTAYKDFSYAKEAIKLGVVDYCLKPIDPQELIQTMKELTLALESKHYQDEWEYQNIDLMDEILEYVRQHLQEKISLQDIGEHFFINKNYVCYLFRKKLNTTFSQFITEERLSRAKKLLKNSNLSIAEISDRVGFKDEFYFNKVFKKHENISPGLFRKLNR